MLTNLLILASVVATVNYEKLERGLSILIDGPASSGCAFTRTGCDEAIDFKERLNSCQQTGASHFNEIVDMITILDKLQKSKWYTKMDEFIRNYTDVEHHCAVHYYTKVVASNRGLSDGVRLYRLLETENTRNLRVKNGVDKAVEAKLKPFINKPNNSSTVKKLLESQAEPFRTIVKNVTETLEFIQNIEKKQREEQVALLKRCTKSVSESGQFSFPSSCLKDDSRGFGTLAVDILPTSGKADFVVNPRHDQIAKVRMFYTTELGGRKGYKQTEPKRFVSERDRKNRLAFASSQLDCPKASIFIASSKTKTTICSSNKSRPAGIYNINSSCGSGMSFYYRLDDGPNVIDPKLKFEVTYTNCGQKQSSLTDDGEGLQFEQISASKLFNLALSLFLI